jgi:uncharacterized glyoxalase superfamily protein PhnB
MPWVTPYLTVKDCTKAIEWYQKAFGFEKKFEMPGPDGKICHAEITWQEASIMLGLEGACGTEVKTPATSGTPSPVSLYVYVPDVDALYARAKAAGATIKLEPQDQFWGDRICGLKDPEGHDWCFATNVKEFDPSKCP